MTVAIGVLTRPSASIKKPKQRVNKVFAEVIKNPNNC